MKQLACRDAGFDCDAVVTADTDEALMARVRPRAREAHGVEITPQLQSQFTGLVREV